jgi:hypothetical protein
MARILQQVLIGVGLGPRVLERLCTGRSPDILRCCWQGSAIFSSPIGGRLTCDGVGGSFERPRNPLGVDLWF